jgi:ketosteroid isomerase-like protein
MSIEWFTTLCADGRVPLPLRWLAVYQKEEERWAVVHAHISVGIPDELAE